VYTATEEPGIRRVLFTQNGGQRLSIGDIKVDKALAREDVFGYKSAGAIGPDKALTWAGDDALGPVGADLTNVTIDGSTARLIFDGHKRDASSATANLPSFTISLEQDSETGRPSAVAGGAKYALTVAFKWNCVCSSGGVAGATIYDKTPLRAITSDGNTAYRIALDDARPWRAYMPSQTQLVIEVGGDPRATSDRISIMIPKPGDQTPGNTPFADSLRIAGTARVFEATVTWRVRDSAGKVVATSHFNASLGSSALWGWFDNGFALPTSLHGKVTLEVYEVSPKDGSEQGLVAIPLTVP
jgi:hypothetical protein